MSFLASPRFLRNVLLADAVSCAATAVLQLGFTTALAQLTNLPEQLLTFTGWFLAIYAAVAAWVAMSQPVPRGLVWLFVAGNFAWCAGCIALLATGTVAPTPIGVAWVLAQAITVAVLAELQWMGLKKQPAPPAWA